MHARIAPNIGKTYMHRSAHEISCKHSGSFPLAQKVVLERPPLDVRARQVVVTLGGHTEGAAS